MVQMGVETTTVTEADMSRQEMDQMNDMVRNEEVRTRETCGGKKMSRSHEDKQEIIWSNVILITLFHILAIRGLFYLPYAKYQSIIFGFIIGGIGGFGVTGGAHRYYTHRSFKAKLPLQIILLACYTVSGQNNIPNWVRDHRVHHKFSETDADPHNANRGFFFSHVGWLMQRKHPEVYRRGKTVDMSDINDDPLVQLHTKYFTLLKILLCFVLPISIPVFLWNETWTIATFGLGIVRYVMNLNFTWSVNSVAHIWGNKPYDMRIQPTQNIMVSVVSMGEGWHNYHHVFPWDYRAAEIGGYLLNLTTMWLDFFGRIGWAYDFKSPSKQLVQQVAVNHGDGSWHEISDSILQDNKTS